MKFITTIVSAFVIISSANAEEVTDRALKSGGNQAPAPVKAPKPAKAGKRLKSYTSAAPTVWQLVPYKSGDLETFSSSELLLSFIEKMGGNPDAKYGHLRNALPSEICADLKMYLDEAFEENATDAMKTDVTMEFEDIQDFVDMVGIDNARNLYEGYRAIIGNVPVNKVLIRRSKFSGGMHIHYHVDGGNREGYQKAGNNLIIVNLNTGEYEGGEITYLTRDGMSVTTPNIGDAVMHGSDIVHGVQAVNGTRYVLVLVSDNSQVEDKLGQAIYSEDSVLSEL